MKKINYNYIAILITYILLIIIMVLYLKVLYNYITIPNCPIYKYFGIYCPACGSTRAVIALSRYDIIQAFFYNPMLIYFFILSTIYLIIQTVFLVLHKEYSIKWRYYIYFGLILGCFNCILQNVLK